MAVGDPKPNEFIRFGDTHGTKPYEFIRFGDIHARKLHEFICFGDIIGPNRWIHMVWDIDPGLGPIPGGRIAKIERKVGPRRSARLFQRPRLLGKRCVIA